MVGSGDGNGLGSGKFGPVIRLIRRERTAKDSTTFHEIFKKRMVDVISRFNSLTLVSSEQTAQAGENAPFTSTIPSGDCVQHRTLPVCLIAAARVREVKPSKSIQTVSSSVPKRRTARPAFLAIRLGSPSVVTVVLAHIFVLARGGAEVQGIGLAGALLVPFPEQGDGVLHHNALLFRALEAQQPVLSKIFSNQLPSNSVQSLEVISGA